MIVIAVLNQKGGAGKTTIATHLARSLQLRGLETILVDSDPQGSARDFAAVEGGTSVMTVGTRSAHDRPRRSQVARRRRGDRRRAAGSDVGCVGGEGCGSCADPGAAIAL